MYIYIRKYPAAVILGLMLITKRMSCIAFQESLNICLHSPGGTDVRGVCFLIAKNNKQPKAVC